MTAVRNCPGRAATVGPKMVELIARPFRRQVPLQGLQEACDIRALSRWHESEVLEWAAREALLAREHGYAKLKKLLTAPPATDHPAVQRAVKPKTPRAPPPEGGAQPGETRVGHAHGEGATQGLPFALEPAGSTPTATVGRI